MVLSGSCIGAHNTAIYWALHSLGAKTVLISLMATVSALPYTLFTLPAGAIADIIDRKKILLVVQLWHACIAVALAVLWNEGSGSLSALCAPAALVKMRYVAAQATIRLSCSS
jgi:MFS family permease